MTGPYPGSVERFPTIRQSRGVLFDACSLAAKFDADHRREWSGHPQARGQIVHRVIAKALKEMSRMSERKIETDVMVELLYNELRQDDVDAECPACGKEVVQRHGGFFTCAAGHEFRSNFVNIPLSEVKDMRWVVIKWAYDNEFDIENLVDVEHRLTSTVEYPDGHGGHVERKVTGQLDAMFVAGEDDEEAIVLDWKDTYSLPAPAEVGFDGYAQQRWYAWLVLSRFPAIQRVTLREHYLRFSTYREATVERGQIDDVRLELAALVERFDRAFEEENFPPSPGRHCMVCPRPAACPIFPAVREAGAITDDETARRYAGEAMVAKRALDQRQKALRAWASVRGPVEISSSPGRERVWGFRESKRVSRPTREQLERAIRLHGTRVNLDELFTEAVTTRFEPHSPQRIEDVPDDAALMNALTDSVRQQSVREES